MRFDHAAFADALLAELPAVEALDATASERTITLTFARLLLRPLVLGTPLADRAGLLTGSPADAADVLAKTHQAPPDVDLGALCRTHGVTWADLGLGTEGGAP